MTKAAPKPPTLNGFLGHSALLPTDNGLRTSSLRPSTPTIFLKIIDAVKPVFTNMANHARAAVAGNSDEKPAKKRQREIKSPKTNNSVNLPSTYTPDGCADSLPDRRSRKRRKIDELSYAGSDVRPRPDEIPEPTALSSPASSGGHAQREHSVNSSVATTDTASSTNGSTITSTVTSGSQTIGKGCRGLRDLAGLNDLLTPYFHIDSAQACSGRQQRPPARYAVAAPSDYASGRKARKVKDRAYESGARSAGSFGTVSKKPSWVNGKNVETCLLDVDMFAEVARCWRSDCEYTAQSFNGEEDEVDICNLIDTVELPQRPLQDEKPVATTRRGRNSPHKLKTSAEKESSIAVSPVPTNSNHPDQNVRWYKLFHARKLLNKSTEEQYRIIHSAVQLCMQKSLSTVTTPVNLEHRQNIGVGEKRPRTHFLKKKGASAARRSTSPAVCTATNTVANVLFTVSPRYLFINDQHIACQYISQFPLDPPSVSSSSTEQTSSSVTSNQNYIQTLYVCEYCMAYFQTRHILEQHMSSFACCSEHEQRADANGPVVRSPPGVEIYRSSDGRHSVFEVSGAQATQYCSHLCLLAKLFLDHKKVCVDIESFNFYVITRNEAVSITDDDDAVDDNACAASPKSKKRCAFMHFIGYFSKELNNPNGYNLSCILVLPCYQQFGYGRFLIALSYLLTRRERPGLVSRRRGSTDVNYANDDDDMLVEPARGTPEVPLSEQGRRAYKAYWKQTISRYIVQQMVQKKTQPVTDESAVAMPKSDDIKQSDDADLVDDDEAESDAEENFVKNEGSIKNSAASVTTLSSRTRRNPISSAKGKYLCCHISVRALQRATGMTLSDIMETLIDMKLLKRTRASTAALLADKNEHHRSEVIIDASKPRLFSVLLEAATPSTSSRRGRGKKTKHGFAAASVYAAISAANEPQQQEHYGRLLLEEDRLHWKPPPIPTPPANNKGNNNFGFFERHGNMK